jgi:hypothetical protein
VIKGNHKSKEQIVRARIHPVASVFACVAMVLAFVASFAGTAFASGASSVKNQSATVQLGYTPLSAPVRVCDTRPTSQTGGVSDVTTASGVSSQCDNSGKALMAGSELDVTFPTTVVPSGAQAVVLNVTAISPSATGYLTAYPATGAAPTQITSNLNVKMGQTVANEVTVQTSSSGVDVYYGPSTNSGASVNIAVDVEGYYMTPTSSSGDPYTAISPVRIADTRCGVSSPPSFCSSENLPSANSSLATVGAGGKIHVQVAGVDSIPSSATAAVLNVTTTDTTSSSFLSVYPTSSAPSPLTSNQNWVAGETIASQVIVGIGTNGDVTLYNDSGNADFVVDVDGYFTAPGTSGSLFTPVSPSRLADTRCGVSPAPSFCSSENLPSANATLSAPSGGQSITVATGAPSNATAVAVNVTDVQPTNGNFLTVYPTGQTSIPVVSTVNWVPGDTYNVVPNFAYATLGTSGDINVYNGPSTTGPANVLVDYYGYFSKPVVTSALTLTTSRTSVPADGTVAITATVTENGALIQGDTVDFTVSPSACGTLSSATPTNGDGQVVVTYTPSDTQGTCTIDAQEADYAMTASTSITQTAPVNSITVAYTPGSVPSSPGSVTATVTNAVGDVSGDTVDFSVSGYPSETCGTLSATSATTNSSGVATVDYAPTSTPGFCTITGTETETNQSGTTEAIVDTSGTKAVSVSSSPTSVGPGGTATLTITGSPDTPVMLSTAPASGTPTACGTVDQFVTTDGSGTATVTYTGSNAIGSCTVTATEAADSDSSSSATVQQTNDLAVAVSPTSLPANGTDTATVTYTITGPGGVPVMEGTVTPSSPVFANTTTECGTISSVSGTTGSTGQATATYTEDTTTAGLCDIAGSDGSGASGSTELVLASTTATSTPYMVTVTASPASIPADVQSTSYVTVVVSNSVGDPVSGDVVGLSTSGSACGTLSSDTATTNSAGQAIVTYSATTTTGTCTISALESEDGQVGSGSITQTAGVNTLSFSSTTVSTTASGTGSVTVTVDNPQDQPVEDDTLTATARALYPTNTVCGTVSVSGATSSTGQASITYTEPSTGTTGFCSVDVTDDTGQSGSFVVDQTDPTNSDTYTNTVAASATSVGAGGTVTITATVESTTTSSTTTGTTATSSSVPVANDPVMFVLTPASDYSPLSCGSLSAEFATTNSSGVATVTYTAPSNQGGECSVGATEAVDSQFGSAYVTSEIVNSLSLTANPTAVAARGTSQITATVTSPNGKPVQGDLVDFTAPSTTGCGTLSAESAYTGANGEATVTYTAGSSTGLFCTIGATRVTATGQTETASVTVDQQN